jgi:predicted ester cyclase
MPGTQRTTALQRKRHAGATAALVRRIVEEACSAGNLAVLDEVLAPPAAVSGDHACTRLGAASTPPLHRHLRELLAAFRAAVPDARWTILEQVTEGETVVTKVEVRGRFSGSLVGLAPPGRPTTLTGVAISRFAAGRLVDLWLQADLLGLLEQLGVLPPLDLARAVTMARVLQAGRLVAGEAVAPPRTPPHPRVGRPRSTVDWPDLEEGR